MIMEEPLRNKETGVQQELTVVLENFVFAEHIGQLLLQPVSILSGQ